MQTAPKRHTFVKSSESRKKNSPYPLLSCFSLKCLNYCILQSFLFCSHCVLYLRVSLNGHENHTYRQLLFSPLQASKANIYCYKLPIHPSIKWDLPEARTVPAVQPFSLLFGNPHTQSSSDYPGFGQLGQLLISINSLPLYQHTTGLVASAFTLKALVFVHLQSKLS